LCKIRVKNFESQGPGKVDVIIPPLSIAEASHEFRTPSAANLSSLDGKKP